MGSPPDDRHAGLDGIRELASRESADIVLAAAARIERLVAEAEAELRVLKGTIDAAVPADDRSGHATPAGGDVPSPVLPVAAPARHALENARRTLDRFAGELASSTTAATRFRVRTAPVLKGAAALALAAACLGVATGWLAMPPSMAGLEPASAGTSVASSEEAPAADAGDRHTASAVRPEADEVRQRGITWLRAYMSGRTAAADARLASPMVRDERTPSERLSVPAARRTITPARVDIFGDAAVLSASVTERSPDGRELVSLVSQLWTRTDGRWELDDVRIVSAAGAEQAFRR